MKIENKYIIKVFIPACEQHNFDGNDFMYWNGASPFVSELNKAFICPHKKSADGIVDRIKSFYGFKYEQIELSISI